MGHPNSEAPSPSCCLGILAELREAAGRNLAGTKTATPGVSPRGPTPPPWWSYQGCTPCVSCPPGSTHTGRGATLCPCCPHWHPRLRPPALPSSQQPLPGPALSRGAVPGCVPERRGSGSWSRLLYYKAEQTSK